MRHDYIGYAIGAVVLIILLIILLRVVGLS